MLIFGAWQEGNKKYIDKPAARAQVEGQARRLRMATFLRISCQGLRAGSVTLGSIETPKASGLGSGSGQNTSEHIFISFDGIEEGRG